jgi:hypothetical protein
MKKIILAGLLALALDVHAYGHGHQGFHDRCCYRGNGMGWVAPAIIGGVIGYELTRPSVYVAPPVFIEQPPVYISPQPYYQAPPVGYHWQQMIDPQTGIAKIVLVPN